MALVPVLWMGPYKVQVVDKKYHHITAKFCIIIVVLLHRSLWMGVCGRRGWVAEVPIQCSSNLGIRKLEEKQYRDKAILEMGDNP